MPEQKIETLEFDGLKVPIRRQPTHELYIALQPPEAIPYIVAPTDLKPEEIIEFVKHWIEVIRELRTDMLKRFEKSKSMKCHYRTGDIVYLLGRPFMLRVSPLSSSRSNKKNVRGRANVKATLRPEISVIDLYLLKPGDYDQGRLAFLAFAKPVLARNAISLIQQCMGIVFPDEHIPASVQIRPMHDAWVRIDGKRGTVWFSERLIPYPAECLVYAYLVELIKGRIPDASEEERHGLLDKGVPQWRKLKEVLAQPSGPYTQQ